MKLLRAAVSCLRCKEALEIPPRRGAWLKEALPAAAGCPRPLGPRPRQLPLKQPRHPDLMEDEAAVPAKP